MATTAIDTYLAAPGSRSLLLRVTKKTGSVLRRIGELSEGARAARHAGRLTELSDEQLAARGIARDQIVAHAFRHLMHR